MWTKLRTAIDKHPKKNKEDVIDSGIAHRGFGFASIDRLDIRTSRPTPCGVDCAKGGIRVDGMCMNKSMSTMSMSCLFIYLNLEFSVLQTNRFFANER
jgi:hypothetical protein